jgi:hypothetical protein
MVFGEFEGKDAGAVDAKFKYPLIYAKGSDIRLYDTSTSFVIFESDVTAKMREKIDSIKLREIYSQLSAYNKLFYELNNPLQSIMNFSTTSTAAQAIGVGVLGLAAGIYYMGSKLWKKKQAASAVDSKGVDSKGVDSKGASQGNGSNVASAQPPIKTERKTRVTKAQLQAKARDLGIQYKPSDTTAKLQSLIAAKSGSSNRRTMRKSRGSRSRR